MAFGALTSRPGNRPTLNPGAPGLFTAGQDAIRAKRDLNLEGINAAVNTRPALPLERGPMRDRAKEARNIAAMAGNSASAMIALRNQDDARDRLDQDAAQKADELAYKRDELESYKLGLGYDKLNATNQLGQDRLDNQASIAGMNNSVRYRIATMADGTKRLIAEQNNQTRLDITGQNNDTRIGIADAGNTLKTDQFNAKGQFGADKFNAANPDATQITPQTVNAPTIQSQGQRPALPTANPVQSEYPEDNPDPNQADALPVAAPATPPVRPAIGSTPSTRPALPAGPSPDEFARKIAMVKQGQQDYGDAFDAQQSQIDAIRSDPEFKRQAIGDLNNLRPEDVGMRSALPVAQPNPTPTLAIGGRDRGKPGDPGFDPLPSELDAERKYQERMQQARIQAGLVPPERPLPIPTVPYEQSMEDRKAASDGISLNGTSAMDYLTGSVRPELPAPEQLTAKWRDSTTSMSQPLGRTAEERMRTPLPRPELAAADRTPIGPAESTPYERFKASQAPLSDPAPGQAPAPDDSLYPYWRQDAERKSILTPKKMAQINRETNMVAPNRSGSLADIRSEGIDRPELLPTVAKSASSTIGDAAGGAYALAGETADELATMAFDNYGLAPESRDPERVALDQQAPVIAELDQLESPRLLAAMGVNKDELNQTYPNPRIRLAYLKKLQTKMSAGA